MPLIVLCGQPCSGKSGVAAELKLLLAARGVADCTIIDEPSLHLERNAAYAGGGACLPPAALQCLGGRV